MTTQFEWHSVATTGMQDTASEAALHVVSGAADQTFRRGPALGPPGDFAFQPLQMPGPNAVIETGRLPLADLSLQRYNLWQFLRMHHGSAMMTPSGNVRYGQGTSFVEQVGIKRPVATVLCLFVAAPLAVDVVEVTHIAL